jgi:release factor glutamine methyltransferase
VSGALTIGEILRRSTAYLTQKGSSSPRLDADLLLAHALGLERLQLYTDSERPLTPAELERARELVGRRARREPIAYLLGERAFRRLRLGVGPEVLVPRPETEILVEWALAVAPEGGTVLDWGTGSGAVALALADEGPDLRVTAVDRSEEALARARSNDLRCPGAEVEWLLSDGFSQLAGRRFDVIAANPPYLSPGDLAGGPPELGFEPEGALVSGPTGLEAISRIVRDAPGHLEPGGWVLIEVGASQAGAAGALLREAGFEEVGHRDDLAGVARVVGGRRA